LGETDRENFIGFTEQLLNTSQNWFKILRALMDREIEGFIRSIPESLESFWTQGRSRNMGECSRKQGREIIEDTR